MTTARPNMNYWRIMDPSSYGDLQVTMLATEDESADLARLVQYVTDRRDGPDKARLYEDPIYERWESEADPVQQEEGRPERFRAHRKLLSIHNGVRTEHDSQG